jgi:hypothetical protein
VEPIGIESPLTIYSKGDNETHTPPSQVPRSISPEPIILAPVYDPTATSLTKLPYEVLAKHLLPKLNTESILNLFMTCKLFHEMIAYPSADNMHNWDIVRDWTQYQRLMNDLPIGIPSGWIQGIVYLVRLEVLNFLLICRCENADEASLTRPASCIRVVKDVLAPENGCGNFALPFASNALKKTPSGIARL